MLQTDSQAGAERPRASSHVVHRYTAKNFTQADDLELRACDYSDDPKIAGKMVTLTAGTGPCSFHFSMTPEQAYKLAFELNFAADVLLHCPAAAVTA